MALPQPMPVVKKTPPNRWRLEIMLRNGPEFIDVVERAIKEHSLPYFVEISDGTKERNANEEGTAKELAPLGYGILRDTLSDGELHLNKFITKDETTLKMKEDAAKIAPTEYEVLIVGPTGTGKEIIAKAMIAKRAGKLCAVNCAGFPEQLIESELFGHEKGSFTGAETTKTGLIQSAKGGVMFLDEVGELPLPAQAKLLRTIQEKTIRKVGSLRDEVIDCKFVFATHRDLRAMVEKGTFRQDLFARISTLELSIEPLSMRECDIVPITASLKGGPEFIKAHGDDLTNGVLDFPLNVRSIQQYVTRYAVLGRLK